jgi:WD40 repeat protein
VKPNGPPLDPPDGITHHPFMRLLNPGIGTVTHAAFAPTGRHLVLTGEKGFAVGEWPAVAVGRAAFHVEPTEEKLIQAAWHPDGTMFAAGGVDCVAQVWDTRPRLRKELVLFAGQDQEGMKTAVAFSPDGAYLALGDGWAGEASRVLMVRVATWTLVDRIELHQDMVGALAFTRPDTLVSGGADRKVVAQRLDDALSEPRMVEVAAQVQGLAVGGGNLAVAFGGRVAVWPIDADGFPRPTETPNCRGHTRKVKGIAFSADGRLLVSTGDDGTVRFWEPTTGICRTALDPHIDKLRTVAVSPDGLTVVAAGDSGTVVVLDAE